MWNLNPFEVLKSFLNYALFPLLQLSDHKSLCAEYHHEPLVRPVMGTAAAAAEEAQFMMIPLPHDLRPPGEKE